MVNDRAVDAKDNFRYWHVTRKLFIELDFFIWYPKRLSFLKIENLTEPA